MTETDSIAGDEQRLGCLVFISYATADRREALSICKAIEGRGTKCWLACRDVGPGENYQEAIVRAIRGARAMVLVFSRAANTSDEIKKELSLASKYRVPLIAIRTQDIEPSDAFAYELSTRQWVDALQGRDLAIAALVRKLRAIPAPPASSQRTLSDTSIGGTATIPKRAVAASMAAILVLAAVVATLVWKPFGSGDPLTVQIGAFHALGSVPADAPTAFQQELRAAFGDEHAVVVKDSNATFRLGGSIRDVAGSLRYSVQLTDSGTGEMLWSGSRDIESAAGATAPQQAAERISWVIRCGLADAMEHPRRLPTRALSLYLQHCELWFWGEASLERALDAIKKAVEQAPDFSRAWSKLAENAARAALEAPPEAKTRLAATGHDAVQRALELDPRNGNAYLAWALLQPVTAWSEREQLHLKSVRVRESDCACEQQNYGRFLLQVGRPSEAVTQLERAVDMQPRTPNANWWLMTAYYYSGDRSAGDRVAETMAAFWKGSPFEPSVQLERALAGRQWREAARLTRQSYTDPADAPLGQALDALASRIPARMTAARDALLRMPDDRTPDFRVILLTQLGATKPALALLRRALEQGDVSVSFLFDPQNAPLRADPEWTTLLKEAGLVEFWRASRKRPDFCSAAEPPPVCATI